MNEKLGEWIADYVWDNKEKLVRQFCDTLSRGDLELTDDVIEAMLKCETFGAWVENKVKDYHD
jgi:hypothetical protein